MKKVSQLKAHSLVKQHRDERKNPKFKTLTPNQVQTQFAVYFNKNPDSELSLETLGRKMQENLTS